MQLQQPFAVITPTLDGEILAVIAEVDASFSASDLARMLPERSRAGIRLALQRLAQQGVLDVERFPSNVRYAFNQDHLAAEPIKEIARLRSTLIERIENELDTWGTTSPTWASLFGSAATGQMRPDSDIDLFLVQPDDPSPSTVDRWETLTADLAAAVARWTGNDVRVLEMSAEDVRRGGGAEPVLDDIDRDGIRITGDPGWLGRTLAQSRRTRSA